MTLNFFSERHGFIKEFQLQYYKAVFLILKIILESLKMYVFYVCIQMLPRQKYLQYLRKRH